MGVGILWPARGVCGLAHCLLPVNPERSFNIDGRFVTQAVPSLLALMKIRPENHAEVQVVLAGGGNMTSPGAADPAGLIGAQNFQTALNEIAARGLPLVHRDGGGDEGRKIFIDAADFTYRIETIPRIIGVA